MTIQIDEKLLAEFDNVMLMHGSHKDVSDGVCAMEAVAWLAGEKHSDAPMCACPALTRMVQRLNDRWDDVQRQALKPFLRRLIGTRDSSKLVPRAYMAADWAVRDSMPRWLDHLAMPAEAAELRALAPIVDKATARAGSEAYRRARESVLKKYPDAAYAAAYAYAYAYDAAYDAAYAAAYAYDAAYAAAYAYDAAYAAAYAAAAADAADAAAADAAADAADADAAAAYAYADADADADPSKRAAFEAHVAAQNASVLDLLSRMIDA